MISDVSSQPFSARTMAPIARPDISYKNQVIESSRRQFARPRAQVEENIRNWHSEGTIKEVRPQSEEEYKARKNFSQSNSQKPVNSFVPYQNISRPPAMEIPKSEPLKMEVPKADQNKLAFMKAAEDLRMKEVVQKSPTVSLSSLDQTARRDSGKTPTKENISSLKDALAHVVKSVPPKKDEISQIKPEPQPVVEQKKPEQPTKYQPKKEDAYTLKPGKNEVPEDVLRNILKMEEK